MIGIDWESAPLALREQVVVSWQEEESLLERITRLSGARGCVLLQTCNRFEVYVDLESVDIMKNIRRALTPDGSGDSENSWLSLSGDAAHRRLCQVACGLNSQLLGEEQILTQVKTALKTAREAGTTTPELETLFRIAVTAGKAARTQVRLKTVSPSAASRAVELAAEAVGGLEGRRVLVIGNGEMGRLAVSLFVEAGCDVTITLRSYRHGETIVPKGCKTIPYDRRQEALACCDILVSATRSPHYTVSAEMLDNLTQPPRVVVDISLPRDVEPACRNLEGVTLYDLDDLKTDPERENRVAIEAIDGIIDKHLADFAKWKSGRDRWAQKQRRELAVFAGTSDGRELIGRLAAMGVKATVYVATEHGEAVLPRYEGVHVRVGRLDAGEMVQTLQGVRTVVDATHPYATSASTNIQQAADEIGAEYLRLVRPRAVLSGNIRVVTDAAAAAACLAETEGPVLLTTGSKELEAYRAVPDYVRRLYPRVLPDPDVVRRCIDLGFDRSHLICMQGPFTREFNRALLSSIGAKWLVTKESGDAGGLQEKIEAAEAAGAGVILIGRPGVEDGYTLEELVDMLKGEKPRDAAALPARFPLFVDLTERCCLVVGAGPVGLRRMEVLSRFGARVTAIAPAFPRQPGGVICRERSFQAGDTAGMYLVVAATDSPTVNRQVAEECQKAGIPVSVADCPEACTFFFPAVCESANLTAGIVSKGDAHSLTAQSAVAIRTLLEELDP